MRLVFTKGTIDAAPKGYVRVRITHEPKGTRKFVREGAVEWLELGAGKPTDMNYRKFMVLCRSVVQTAKGNKARKIAIQFDRTPEFFENLQNHTPEEISRVAAENFEMANFDWNVFKTKPKEGWNTVEEILLYGGSSKSIEKAAQVGQMVGQGVNACRALANTPGGDMTPLKLAKAAKEAVKGLAGQGNYPWARKRWKSLVWGLFWGSQKGRPRSLHLPSWSTELAAKKSPVVLAGKGVTFDSGGLNLKPSGSIYEMHMDMSGAASVIHAVALAARLKLKKNVIGLLPSVENMPGNSAYRPGDVLKSLSGKTIEVLNTDAEGRLILADALTYAKRFNPSVVFDVATLTGAAVSALGLHASGLMTRDDKVAKKVEEAGEESGDYVWRLPLWDEYEEAIKGTFADITNSATGPYARSGGAIEGGMFLWQFAKELGVPVGAS